MAEFSVIPLRGIPYLDFMFRVMWDGVYVAGLSKMSPLKRLTAPVTHRAGGDPTHDRKTPGLTTYDAVTLERGVTHDLAFEAWANKVASLEQPGISLPDFRKDLIVDVFNEANQKVLSYKLFRCWVSEYQALPALDASSAVIAIQTIKLELEGWERDVSVTEPTEQSV